MLARLVAAACCLALAAAQQEARTKIEARWCPQREGGGETPITCVRDAFCPDERVLWTGGDEGPAHPGPRSARRAASCGPGLVCCLPQPVHVHGKRYVQSAPDDVANDIQNQTADANPLSLSFGPPGLPFAAHHLFGDAPFRPYGPALEEAPFGPPSGLPWPGGPPPRPGPPGCARERLAQLGGVFLPHVGWSERRPFPSRHPHHHEQSHQLGPGIEIVRPDGHPGVREDLWQQIPRHPALQQMTPPQQRLSHQQALPLQQEPYIRLPQRRVPIQSVPQQQYAPYQVYQAPHEREAFQQQQEPYQQVQRVRYGEKPPLPAAPYEGVQHQAWFEEVPQEQSVPHQQAPQSEPPQQQPQQEIQYPVRQQDSHDPPPQQQVVSQNPEPSQQQHFQHFHSDQNPQQQYSPKQYSGAESLAQQRHYPHASWQQTNQLQAHQLHLQQTPQQEPRQSMPPTHYPRRPPQEQTTRYWPPTTVPQVPRERPQHYGLTASQEAQQMIDKLNRHQQEVKRFMLSQQSYSQHLEDEKQNRQRGFQPQQESEDRMLGPPQLPKPSTQTQNQAGPVHQPESQDPTPYTPQILSSDPQRSYQPEPQIQHTSEDQTQSSLPQLGVPEHQLDPEDRMLSPPSPASQPDSPGHQQPGPQQEVSYQLEPTPQEPPGEGQYYQPGPVKAPGWQEQGAGRQQVGEYTPGPADGPTPPMPAAPGPDAENTIPPETAVADSPPDRATDDPLPDPPESSSRSARMCERYTNLVSRPLQATSLLLDDESPIKTRVEECANFTPLVVGGQNASENEFPHMAAIGFRSGGELGWLCGGSLISEQFVLTAAHCTHTAWGPPVAVRLGTRNIGADAWPPPLDAAVRDVVVHPLYAPPARYHDIALVRLARPVAVSRRIRPACLPTQDPGVEAVAVATGWGRLSYAGDTTDVLQKVSLRVWDGPACSRLYPPDAELGRGRLREGLGPGMLCAGDAFSTKDTCQGDSGGPLQVSVGCSFQVVGITSFGKECGLGLPAVYTRVSQYVSWIEDVVWPQ